MLQLQDNCSPQLVQYEIWEPQLQQYDGEDAPFKLYRFIHTCRGEIKLFDSQPQGNAMPQEVQYDNLLPQSPQNDPPVLKPLFLQM